MRTNVYIDAANLFYGGEKSLGWRIDYEKLYQYLKEKYEVDQVVFFGGVDIYNFPFDYLAQDSVPIHELEQYFTNLIERGKETERRLISFQRRLQRVRFYRKLEEFGYVLVLKPVKLHYDAQGKPVRKANCDVDMTLYLLQHQAKYDRVIVMSGDGDFLPVLKFLRAQGKKVLIFARGPRTARELKGFAGDEFLDFEYLRERIKQIHTDTAI